jgi:hypothetical protein
MEISVKINVDDRRIQDLLCCAFEGGSNYWYKILQIVKPTTHGFEKITGVERLYQYPLDPTGRIVIGDREDPELKEILDINSIKKGLVVMQEKFPCDWSNFMTCHEDADTGDVFLQCCLFSDVIFS